MLHVPTMRLFRWTAVVFLLITLAIGGLFAWNLNRFIDGTAPNAYAMWWTGDLVIQHLRTHEDAWPSGWDDLRAAHDQLSSGGGARWPFDDTRKRIRVDFDVDPRVLAAVDGSTAKPPFHVIGVRSGKDVCWEGAEPNAMIHAYLQKRDGHERP